MKRGFEAVDAADAPTAVGDGLDQFGFAIGLGIEAIGVREQMGFVAFGVVGGEQDGVAGEAGFQGIAGRLGLAFGGLRTRGELGIGLIRCDLCLR